MSGPIWPTVHAERAALIADLDGLTAEQWETPSLCEKWSVAEVAAHLVAAATTTPVLFVARFARARFDFDRYTANQVRREADGGPAATLATFRAAQARRSAPPGPGETWLGEAFVHGEDIRRPLGIRRSYPVDEVARTVRFYARSNLVIGGRDRVAGLRLVATDTDLTVGSGPVVEGPVMSLLLATSGRTAAIAELSGPGVAVLLER